MHGSEREGWKRSRGLAVAATAPALYSTATDDFLSTYPRPLWTVAADAGSEVLRRFAEHPKPRGREGCRP